MRKSFLLTILLCAVAYLTLPLPGLSASLPQRIGKARERVAVKERQAGVLTTQISAYNLRIRSLQGDING